MEQEEIDRIVLPLHAKFVDEYPSHERRSAAEAVLAELEKLNGVAHLVCVPAGKPNQKWVRHVFAPHRGEAPIIIAAGDAGFTVAMDGVKHEILGLVYNGVTWVSTIPDTELAPEPGKPPRRKSAMRVIADKVIQLARQ